MTGPPALTRVRPPNYWGHEIPRSHAADVHHIQVWLLPVYSSLGL